MWTKREIVTRRKAVTETCFAFGFFFLNYWKITLLWFEMFFNSTVYRLLKHLGLINLFIKYPRVLQFWLVSLYNSNIMLLDCNICQNVYVNDQIISSFGNEPLSGLSIDGEDVFQWFESFVEHYLAHFVIFLQIWEQNLKNS